MITVNTDTRKVAVECKTRTRKGGLGHQTNWTFDFTNTTDEQILELATKSVVIMQQSGFRRLPVKQQKDVTETVDVHTLLTTKRERVKKEPIEVARELLAGMSDERREKFLSEYK